VGSEQRPVWLFSLDSHRYPDAFPMASASLKSYFARAGHSAFATDVQIVHFNSHLDVALWLLEDWPNGEEGRAGAAVAAGQMPVIGLSCYTWNIEQMLRLARAIKSSVPDILVVAGGPQVQRAEDFLSVSPIDAVVLGEGEVTFAEVLDATRATIGGVDLDKALSPISGVAWRTSGGSLRRNPERARLRDLDELGSPIDAVPLCDENGRSLYRRVSYETSRGCPYKCSFCEWGTGALGARMFERSLPRIRQDLERLVAAGVEEIFFCDSNFGALPSDEAKADLLVELKERLGFPTMFCTSWSKASSPRVHRIARRLHRAGLLEHYTLALQTMTDRALEESNRKNLPVNRFERIVSELVSDGIPVTTELIWPLPGDTLAEFRRGLDRVTAAFTSASLYGYTLLPGTTFYERREELQLETVQLREVGNWTLDYVVASSSCPRSEGLRGYFLITAHIVLNRGNIIPLVSRFLAIDGRVSVSAVLEEVLANILQQPEFSTLDASDGLQVYAARDTLYRQLVGATVGFRTIRRCVLAALARLGAATDLVEDVTRILALDEALVPRSEGPRESQHHLDFDGREVYESLRHMRRPEASALLIHEPAVLNVMHPRGPDDLLGDLVDGHEWAGVLRGHHAVDP
jgi:radical SAM superfamily enzyme YgiQ (UPF0313 family)